MGHIAGSRWLLNVLVLGAVVHLARYLATAQPAGGETSVTSPEELLAALQDPAVSSIALMKPMALPHGFGPVTVSRQLLISSPVRVVLDWCDEICNSGATPLNPFIILAPGAMVTFNRIFFRNFLPHSSGAMVNSPDLDFVNSPVPFVVSTGGQSTYNLVVFHWLPAMFWVYKESNTYWAQAAVSAIVETRNMKPVQFAVPDLYTIKSFSTDGSATVVDCYMPFDVDGCYTDQPFNTTLIYCPYSFKDSLKNPWVDHVVVFHDIGLDRLVNSYRNPVVVNHSVEYISCPGTRHVMDLDNITNSVVVSAGGSLTFRNMVMQGSKSQNKTDWPSSIPLLLSTFKPIQSGSVTLRDSVVRVPNMNQLIDALAKLPNGGVTSVEVPNLQPAYAGPAPKPGDSKFVIRLWQLQQQRWLTARVGGNTLMDKLGASGTASWQFFNVTVASFQPLDCFGGAYTQGSAVEGSYSTVSSGQQLVEQLNNNTARYIKVVSDIKLPDNLTPGSVAVNRIVEVRSCHPSGAYTVDWNGLRDAVTVTGHAIFEGDLVMTGISWSREGANMRDHQSVNALRPVGLGLVEYEDLTLVAQMTPDLWGNNTGYTHVAQMLGVNSLEDYPLNMSVIRPASLLLRGFYLNRSASSNGQVGMESFLDVNVRWEEKPEAATGSHTPLAAIIAPVVVGVFLIAMLALIAVQIAKRRKASGAEAVVVSSGKGDLLPRVFANATGYTPEDLSRGNSDVNQNVPSTHKDDDKDWPSSELTSANIAGKARSGPSQDIAQACRNMVLHKTAHEADELVLQSVLGEGSYGKVFKGTWKGTTVAVKIMVLPSYMTGKEKREKMAVMETAISSSLSHPNVVQTYTYAVEPVRSNTSLSDKVTAASGPGASISMHDSTFSWGAQQRKKNSGDDSGDGSDGAAAFSWEVRLVQEFCDLGSLRDALKQGKFRESDSSVNLSMLIDTALDVARAMAHLHTHNILHSDLKARNVLLRSDAHDKRGFAAKVADFGLSLTIDPNATHVSNAFQGTMTHMAPETLMSGQISRASDVFAYGILLWELYTGDHAYKGVPRALLGHNITRQGLRPTFPADTPFDWQFLACRCWETDAAIRPSFEQILQELKRMKAKLAAANGEAASGSPPGSLAHAISIPSSYSIPTPLQLPVPPPVRALSQQRLPSIEDTSDTLPTELDRALWQQQYQQTLEQQEQQRQDLQRQRSSNLSDRTGGSLQAAAVPGAAPTPGYTGTSTALARIPGRNSDSSKQSAAAGKTVPAAVWSSPLYNYPATGVAHDGTGLGQQVVGVETHSVYVDDSEARTGSTAATQVLMMNSNVHSTMVHESAWGMKLQNEHSTLVDGSSILVLPIRNATQ